MGYVEERKRWDEAVARDTAKEKADLERELARKAVERAEVDELMEHEDPN